jgi:hypothetical protein
MGMEARAYEVMLEMPATSQAREASALLALEDLGLFPAAQVFSAAGAGLPRTAALGYLPWVRTQTSRPDLEVLVLTPSAAAVPPA